MTLSRAQQHSTARPVWGPLGSTDPVCSLSLSLNGLSRRWLLWRQYGCDVAQLKLNLMMGAVQRNLESLDLSFDPPFSFFPTSQKARSTVVLRDSKAKLGVCSERRKKDWGQIFLTCCAHLIPFSWHLQARANRMVWCGLVNDSLMLRFLLSFACHYSIMDSR